MHISYIYTESIEVAQDEAARAEAKAPLGYRKAMERLDFERPFEAFRGLFVAF